MPMKTRNPFFVAMLALLAATVLAHSQSTTAFTYQGRLTINGQPANGHFDFRFLLYGEGNGGNPVANAIAKPPIFVTNGLFSTTLDYGTAGFAGDKRWLEIAVRPTGTTGNYQTLMPRQRITATPYALQAAGIADGVVTVSKLSAGGGVDGQVLKLNGGQLTWSPDVGGGGVSSVASGLGLTGGPITSAGTLAIDTSVVPQLNAANSFPNPANSFVGSFAGSGSALTNMNAAGLASGTLNDARLSANVGLRNANQIFTGANVFAGMATLTNTGNTFNGTFTGNGSGLTGLNGGALQNDSVNSNKLDVATRALLGGAGGGGFNPALPNDYNGTFTGSGIGLTNLNAAGIVTGTLGDARLSANVALRNSQQIFTGANNFSGAVIVTNSLNTFAGNGAGLANLNGANLQNGTVNSNKLDAATRALLGGSGSGFNVSQSNTYNGTFIGNGAGLTNISATLTNTLAGDVTGSAAATVVARIRGVNVSATAPTANQHLRYNGSAWTPGAVAMGTDVSGTLPLANGGTAATTAANARNNLGAAASGANSDITSLTGLTTPLAPNQGGIGLSSFTTGDLLFANNSSSLARLADVATGNALISGGVGNAPAWGKVGLTTHVTGALPLGNGGTAATTAANARNNLGAAASGANSDITSLTGLTTPLAPNQGGIGLSSFTTGDLLFANNSSSLARLADVATGNALISGGVGNAPSWGKVGLTTHVTGTLPLANGGTAATTAANARNNLGAAASGANSDITSLTGLNTPLAPNQGGSGQSAYSTGDLLFAPGANSLARRTIGAAGTVLTSRGGVPIWTNANDHSHFGQVWSGATIDGFFVDNNSNADGASGIAGVVRDTSSQNFGVFGQSSSVQGTGVQGLALAVSGTAIGVSGESAAAAGTGVYGLATAGSGSNTGVIGESSSPDGTGVFGQALATTGTPVGVYGYCAAATGYGLYTPNRLYVGNNAFVGGHLTIGTGSRIQADAGTTNLPGITFFGNPTSGMFSPATNVLGFATSGNQRMRIAPDGKVGIGRTAATNRFEVEGEASKATAGGWLANSDGAIKTDVRTVTGALDKLARVRPVAFRYTPEYLRQHPDIEDKVYYNVIAQEFAQVFPESVKSSGETLNGKEILQVDTHPATITSIAAVQELRELVLARDRDLARLRSQNEKLEARLSEIERRLVK